LLGTVLLGTVLLGAALFGAVSVTGAMGQAGGVPVLAVGS